MATGEGSSDNDGRRIASIDIGSNTVKLTIARQAWDGSLAAVLDAGATTRLGESIHSRRLCEPAMERTLSVLLQCVAACAQHGVAEIAAVGTSALRDADNNDEFVERARSIGLTIDILTGEDEARLSALAVRSDPRWRAEDSILVIDIGGGSTELVLDGSDAAGQQRVSLQLGAVRLTEAFLTLDSPPDEQVDRARRAVADAFGRLPELPSDATAVGVGGTLVNMGAVCLGRRDHPHPDELQGLALTGDEIDRQIQQYRSMPLEARRSIPGLDPARADVILAGALILEGALSAARLRRVAVSCRGLRWGVLYERFGRRAEAVRAEVA